MGRWFRWYEGTTEDAKFRAVARVSRVTVRDVIALWAFILEDAAHLDHRGVCQRNEDFMSATLDFDEGVVERILEAMEDVDMISVGTGAITICNWNKRQFESDTDPTAARRQREKRERDKARDASVSNGRVTRDTGGSDTDTDTDKIYSPVAKATRTKVGYSEEFEIKFWQPYPRSPTMSKSEAWKSWLKLTPDQRVLACRAVEPYRNHLRSKPNLETVHACRFLSQERFEGLLNGVTAPASINVRSHVV